MEIQAHFTKLKSINEPILEFFDNDSDSDHIYEKFVNLINVLKIHENSSELTDVLQLIVNIVNNHHRLPNFFNKIKQIILFFKDDIQNFFSNSEIYNIFKESKLILLILFEERILIPDLNISNIISNNRKQAESNQFFFYPEIIKDSLSKKTKKRMEEILQQKSDKFDILRKSGENDSYICELIRNDSVDKFIIFINETNSQLTRQIEPSIFETNPIFIKNKSVTLIEYAAFYGSIQIFNYLHLNNVKLSPTLWLYVIHSRNPELIQFLEEKKVKLPNNSYIECIEESIKCHHNEIAEYFIDNYGESDFKSKIEEFALKYHNFMFVPENMNYEFTFKFACKYNYIYIVKFLLDEENINFYDNVL